MKTQNTKYKVKGLDCRGNTIHRVVTLETPIFEEKKHEFEGHKFVTTVTEQLDNYPIEMNVDFRDHVVQQDMDLVLNWVVVEKKKKTNKVAVIKHTFDQALAVVQEHAKLDDEIVANIAHVYYNMKEVIEHLPVKEQLRIVLRGTDVAALAATEAYKSINRLYSKFDEMVAEKKELSGRTYLTEDDRNAIRDEITRNKMLKK